MKFETIYVDKWGEVYKTIPQGWAVRSKQRGKYYDKKEHTTVQQTVKIIEKMTHVQQTLF